MADIFEAIRSGDKVEVERLIRKNPSVAVTRNEQGVSAVLFARYMFKLDILDALLATGPELDVFEAAALGRTERVAELLDADAALAGGFARDGFTALQLASFFGHPETARLLLARGAEVNAVARNGMAIMPLHAAVAGKHHEVVEALLAAGANVNARQEGGWTPLHEAGQHGDRRLVDMLLAAGADPSLGREGGETPADTAAAHGHTEIADLLTARV
jgi:uncharacterized protein